MNLLFVCTHNRCRSILSEAICNHLAGDRVHAFSAGSQPVGEVHPLSIKYLTEKGISTEGLRSQSWNDFDASQIDVVITVCDSAANEQCPLWIGDCVKVHWGLPDPSKLQGTDQEVRQAFFDVMQTIEQRIKLILALDFAYLGHVELESALKKIAEEVIA